jgi:hypothetical protein
MGIDGLQTRADIEAFVRQRLFRERRAYRPWWELEQSYAEPQSTVNFQGSWLNATTVGTFNTAAFYLDLEAFVHLKGGVEWKDAVNNAPDTSTIFTLPEGFWPSVPQVFPAAAQLNDLTTPLGPPRYRSSRIVVRADGSVDFVYTPDGAVSNMVTAWLDGITFRIV